MVYVWYIGARGCSENCLKKCDSFFHKTLGIFYRSKTAVCGLYVSFRISQAAWEWFKKKEKKKGKSILQENKGMNDHVRDRKKKIWGAVFSSLFFRRQARKRKKKLKEKKTRGKYGAGKLTITCQRRKNPEIEWKRQKKGTGNCECPEVIFFHEVFSYSLKSFQSLSCVFSESLLLS